MYSVPSEPWVIPCGSPGRDHRRTTFESRVGAGVSADCAWRDIAADKVSSTIAAVRSLLECVGEVFDNRIREKLLTHLTQLPLDFRSWLPTIRKRYTEQLADPNIFHTGESERAEGVLNRFSLRVEDRGLQLDDDGGFHSIGSRVAELLGCWVRETQQLQQPSNDHFTDAVKTSSINPRVVQPGAGSWLRRLSVQIGWAMPPKATRPS